MIEQTLLTMSSQFPGNEIAQQNRRQHTLATAKARVLTDKEKADRAAVESTIKYTGYDGGYSNFKDNYQSLHNDTTSQTLSFKYSEQKGWKTALWKLLGVNPTPHKMPIKQ
jgi:hypothetical protein